MSGKWSDSDRSSRLPPDWEKRRKVVLKRDAYQCQGSDTVGGRKCLEPATEVDHMKRGDDHDLLNLQSLCHRHHNLKTQREAAEARALNRERVSSSYRRRDVPHPDEY